MAPLKAISLPRLELAAALLLARLISKISESFDVSNIRTFLWSDSTVALHWLSSPSRKWTVFVANRVGEIQRLTDIGSWRHVSSGDNPADILSRGIQPLALEGSSHWWHGPAFLKENEDRWPSSDFSSLKGPLPEERILVAVAGATAPSTIDELLSRFSNLSKVCRVLAYCMRFIKGRRQNPPTTFVSHQECHSSLQTICKIVQRQTFPSEFKALSEGRSVSGSSDVLSLSPFMHEDGLIRVGGRLRNANLDFSASSDTIASQAHVDGTNNRSRARS